MGYIPEDPSTWPRWGRVTLKPFTAGLTEGEWQLFYETFRDAEIAEWNGSRPIKMPLWLFKRLVNGDVARRDRVGFGILDPQGAWLGTVELYDLTARQATLGILLGAKDRWGQGFGTEAVQAVLVEAFTTMGLTRVKLNTFGHNLRAQRSFAKAGFEVVAVRPGTPRFGLSFRPQPAPPESVHMEITLQQWTQRHPTGTPL